MNIELPNGYVIEDIPEGTTKDEIARKAVSSGIATWEDFGGQPEEESKLSDIFTGDDRKTEYSEAKPEFDEKKLSLLAAGLDPETPLSELLSDREKFDQLQGAHKSKIASGDFAGFFRDALGQLATPFTTGDKEVSDISRSRFENLQRAIDEKGNEYLVNPDSGYSVVVNKPGFSTRDAVNLGANAAAFATGGAASTIPRAAAKDAAIQSVIEGVQSQGGGEFDAEEVAIAGGLGGGFKGLENLGGMAYRAIKGAPNEDAVRLIGDIESSGLTARTQDVLPPQTRPGRMMADIGELNPITAGQQAKQQQAREKLVEEFTDRFVPSYSEIKESIKGKRAQVDRAAVSAMDRAIEKASGAELVKQNSTNAIESEIKRLTELPNGTPRTKVDQSSLNILNDYLDDINNSSSINDLKDLRTNFRDDLSPEFGKRSNTREGAIKRIYGAITKDMDETIESVVTPREFAQYKKGNAIYGREAEKLKKSKVKNILQAGDELSPEDINRKLFGDSVGRQQLFASLNSNGRENARAAMISKLWNESKSVNSFLGKLENNSNKEALNTFFRGSSRKELEGLKRALRATSSAQDAALNPPTGQRLAPLALGGGAFYDFGAMVGATLGSAAAYKIYQSKPVRNILLKLANTPAGSTAFEANLKRLNSLLLPVAQAATSTE